MGINITFDVRIYALLFGIRLYLFIPVELSMSKYIQTGYGLLSFSAQLWPLLCLVIIVFFEYRFWYTSN